MAPKIMKFFIDTEFNERGLGYATELISIAMVDESGREFYHVVRDSDFSKDTCNDWVKKFVLPKIEAEQRTALHAIGPAIRGFVGNDRYPQFIGYYACVDWWLFKHVLEAFGGFPAHWQKYMFDVVQWQAQLGWPKIPKKPVDGHHALVDARWIKSAWERLAEIESKAAARNCHAATS